MNEQAPARVCIVLLTGLGDVIHGLPLVNAMKRAWPGVHITWIAEPMPAGVLMPHAAVDDVIVFHKKRGAAGVAQLRRDLRQRPPADVTINLNIYFKSIFPTLFSRGKQRWGFGRDRARDGVWLFANRHLEPRKRRHTQDMFLEFLDALGVYHGALEWKLEITDAERVEQRALIEQLEGRRMIGVVPASANQKKDWTADGYARVVDAIETDFNARAVLIGGPGERETAIARAVEAGAAHKPIWAMGDGVRRLLWLIDAADLVIAPDTGPIHIARAMQKPVIGLYGHTNPWRVGPYRWCEDLWVDRYNDAGEEPDASLADPKLGRMELITADAVIERIHEWQDSAVTHDGR